jgi:cytochrome c-type biogenesis protein CcmH/NrfG
MADASLRLGNIAHAIRAYGQAKQLAVSSRKFEILENLLQQIEFYKDQ